jgi:hypothetical protein
VHYARVSVLASRAHARASSDGPRRALVMSVRDDTAPAGERADARELLALADAMSGAVAGGAAEEEAVAAADAAAARAQRRVLLAQIVAGGVLVTLLAAWRTRG